MKYIHFMGLFLFVMNMVVVGAENNFERANYSQDELVLTRLAWAFQEERLGPLMYEAKHLAPQKELQYVAGGKYVATINANNNTIATKISDQKYITLSYAEFGRLLTDKEICDLANKRLQEKNQK